MDSSRILDVDENIRRVVLVGKSGRVIEDRLRRGLRPLLSTEEIGYFALGSAVKASMSEKWDKTLGPLLYTVSIRPKVTIFRFFLKEGNVVVMAEPKISLATTGKILSALDEWRRSDFLNQLV